ncbi:MAG: 30S ribosomal protein S6 [Candidatus Portnoybacteria bacterium CG10_big_fil_rev_8_21_14_0_10_36_7]|uniref:Small ribosomal subunit protein bS6 n=1 Tax=Candidatus Portnoybacteria bacterium CG10_big_fil_rev_8_21_14_0_10_36_7 TaxID=1974812 RepID=A0A2M8KDJ8_9BACT|nr:MAG: 30S ribosomal protein S6 [Candidatus Portnoybacteria bacterium CG10_big_fil_rev_8_21_14_0_10_36_7]
MHEITYILRPEISPEEISNETKKINELVGKNGGSISNEHVGQKRKLAYQIKKADFGIYVTIDAEIPKENLFKIDAELTLNKRVLRHLIIRKESATYSQPTVVAKPKKGSKRLIGRKKTVNEKTIAPAKPKTSMEELDKKLDEILT